MKHKFGKRLRAWRGKLRQKEAADKLGVSVDKYRSWEHGSRKPPDYVNMAEIESRMQQHTDETQNRPEKT